MNTFKELGLDDQILKALDEQGITKPTDIQREAIPFLLSSLKDFIGLAQTGTGKTAAFGLPLIELIDDEANMCQGVVLSPTRELAQQIAEGLKSFAKYNKKIKIECVYGGAPITTQIKKLKAKPQIVVATPGRLVDLINRKVMDIKQLRYLVLDEADEMLNMGFKEELNLILASTPEDKSTWLFSATMPKDIRHIVKEYMHEPHEISVKSGVEVNTNISHQYMLVKLSDKMEAMKRLLNTEPDLFGVMFCRTKIDTQNIADELGRAGYKAEAIHGDLSQSQRDLVMRKFKDRAVNLLVATDVAARGIDVNDVTHVIHHRLPDELEFYTHRSGRTARAGKKGLSIALVTKGEKRRLEQIQKVLGINFERKLVPSGDEILNGRIDTWMQSILDQDMGQGLPNEIRAKVQEGLESLSKEELIDKLLKKEIDNMGAVDTRDLNVNSMSRSEDGPGAGSRNRRSGFTNMAINIGKIDAVSKGDLKSIILEVSGMDNADLGTIDMQKKRTVFELKESVARKLPDMFKGYQFDDRDIKVEEAGQISKPEGDRGRPAKKRFGGGGGGGGKRRDRDRRKRR
ncbi:DEAD/DEAH box helicase [Reichenbachiella ulvae]|uniref:RNA helicase n=1 Tax=Reichenbachiella ulvae TaxID=2980104 RepID=A0ABT3CS72_9BACT|nr:DEAD/DEAH box helicase [Reichenbachiella ulvae]MCV9386349.1 DEAD/DEAH box helicase [Reichenbachiella ulvae]